MTPFPTPPRGLRWFTSSHSNGSGGECVECSWWRGDALIRDSKRPSGPVIPVDRAAWQVFVMALADHFEESRGTQH
ncbi:DUF397 domain-containing protein [Streptomyces sp. NPDC048577]|uniref:DUF397 domain-containing protein n=1 Tax=Streptomyces sp. NPDC048577 TaxID=3157209 RepID=UPI00341D4064